MGGPQLDHLVVAARTLQEGVDWCAATLGVHATVGGHHVFMGTHNRVINVSAPGFARSYLEIIAIDPTLAAPAHARWFDLDDDRLQQQLQRGPRLVHWLARCDDIEAACAATRAAGIDSGDVTAAERMTPTGLLRWRIALRADGHRPVHGAMPGWIEWGDRHPTDDLAASGVVLESVRVGAHSVEALLPPGVRRVVDPMAPALSATLITPDGRVLLNSPIAKD